MRLPVVGRESELEVLAALLESDLPGPAAVVLEGEAGIGKTTLWSAGVERGRELGYCVLSCRPSEAERALPFCSLGDLLAPVVDSGLPQLSPPLRLALEVALLQRAPPDEPADTLALSRAVHAVLDGLVRSGPLLVAIDDAQWVDQSSAQTLAFALRRLDGSPLRALISHRGTPSGPLLGLEDGRELERLLVGPLGAQHLERLVAAQFDIELTPSRLAKLQEMSGGNPYLALEIMRALQVRRPPLDPDFSFPVPEGIGALLRDRIAGLTEGGADALVLAAAAPQATASLLTGVTGRSEDVQELLAAGILEPAGERLRFSHPLLATVAYEDADPGVRRAAHARLAEAAGEAEERALHLALATDSPDASIADELDAVAARVHRRGAPAAAAELSEHACRLTPEDRREQLWARVRRGAEYNLAAGETARGRELLEKAVDSRAPGPERADLLVRLGQISYTSGEVPAANALFEQALGEAGDDASPRVAAQQALAFTAMFAGDMRVALEHARAALDGAERLGDRGRLALALSGFGLQEFLSGAGLDRACFERALRLEPHVPDVPVEWLPTYTYAGVAMFADELEISRELHERLYWSCLDRGDERALPTLLFPMSRLECAAGNWALASRYANEAVERSQRTGQATLGANALAALALVRCLVGDGAGARAAAEEGLGIAVQAGANAPLVWITAALGFLELSLGDPAGAHAWLAPLSERVTASGLAEPGVVRFVPDYIEALIALGEIEQARQPLLLLENRGRALDRVSARAAASRCRALLESGLGNLDEARTSVAEALAQHERLGQPFELGRTLLVEGMIERRAKERGAARRTLTRALDLFDSLGAALWAEKAAAELARIPGRAPSAGELSETERLVVELVSEGLSNKEIAARLFVTVRTVEANLSKVYAKLGVRSRTELASRHSRSAGDQTA